MSQLIVVLYPAEYQAIQVMAALQDTHNRCLATFGNVALLSKDDEGSCHLAKRMSGVYEDDTWKALMELFMMALSTGLRSFATQFGNFGIHEQFIERLRAALGRKSSALFLLLPSITSDNVFPVLSRFGGLVLQTTLSEPLAAVV